MTDPIRILYIDDYPLDRALVRDALGASSREFVLLEASTEQEFVMLMDQGNFDLVLTDFNILGFTGLQVLERIQSTYPEIPVIMVTGTGSEEIAAEAIKRGAADYVIKTPHYIQRLPHTIQNALANQVLQQQRQDALEQLRENEQRYRELVENLNEGIWGIDKENKTTFVNPAMAAILGYTVEEMLGKHLFEFMGQEQIIEAKKNLARGQEGESRQYEFIFLHNDGSEVFTLINTQPLSDEKGNYQGALAAVQDISERKAARQQMQENEEKYRSLVDNVGAALFLHNMDGRIVDVNQVTLKSYGYTREELLEMNAQDIDPEIDERGDREQYWNKLYQDSPQRFEARHKTRDGSTFPVEISLTPVTIAGEEHIIALAQDITARVQASRNLEQTKETLTTVLESVDAHIYVSDFESYEILYMNQRMREDFGEGLIGKLCYREFRGEEKPCSNCQLDHLIDKQGNPTAERTWEGFNPKTERWYLNTDRAIFWTDQRLAHIQIAVDIHDRKLAEQELQESQAFLNAIYNQSLNAIMVADDQGNYLEVNQAAADLFGHTIEELQSMNVGDLRTHSTPDAAQRYQEYLKTGQEIGEFDFIHSSGEPRVALYHAVRIGENLHLSVLTDITRRKSIERELQKSDAIVKRTIDAVITTLPDGTITFWNKGAEQIYGYTREEALGKSVSMLYPEENLPVLDELMTTITGGEDLNSIQVTNLNKNQQEIIILLSLTTLRDDQDQVLELVGVSKDISAQARMQKIISENEARYRLLFDSALEGLVIHQDGIIQEVNDTFLNFYRCERQDVIGSALIDFAAPESRPDAEDRITNPTDSFNEYYGKRCDGSTFPILLHAKDIKYHGNTARLVSVLDITERKAAETVIKDINKQLLLAQEIASIGNWSLDPEVGVPDWSDEVYKIYERDPELGPHPLEDYAEIYQDSHWEKFNEAIQGAIQKGVPYDIELKLELNSGKTKWIRAICQPDPEPGPAGHILQGTIQDITQSKNAEHALQESELKYRQLFENMLDGFALHQVVLDKNGDPVDYIFLEVNGAFESMTGLRGEEVIRRRVTRVIPGIENDPADWIGRYAKIALQGESARFESYSKPLERWFSILAYQSEPGQFATIFEDITERKEAEIALQDSESRYRNLVESSPDGIITISKTGRVMSFNQRFLELTGFSEEMFLNKHFLQVPTLLPQDLDFFKKIVPQIFQGEKLDPIEFRWKHAGGEIREGEARTSTLQVEGEIIGLLGIVRDITERKKAEQKIHESEQRYRQLYQTAGMGVGYWTMDGKVISFNEIALNNMQMTSEQVIGKHLTDIFPEDLSDIYQERIQAVVDGDKPLEFEDQIALPSGTQWFLSLYSTVKNLEGEIQGVQISSLNITDRKTSEQQLREREAILDRSQEIARVGSYIWDLRDDSLAWSDNMYKIHGLDPDQFSGNLSRVSQQVIHPEDRERVAEEIEQMVLNKKVHSMQFRILFPDGQERVMRSSGEFELDDDGQPIRAVGVHQDITEEIKAQQIIMESRDLLVRLSRAAHSVQNILDPEDIFDTIGKEISTLGFNTTILELNESQTRLHVRFNSFNPQLVSKMIKLFGIKPEDFSFDVKPGGYFESILQSGTTVLKHVESQPFQEVFPGIPLPLINQIRKLFDYESTILAPLMDQDQPIGLLTVLGSELTEEDLTPIDIFANQASTALRNARYAAVLQERAEELVQLTTTLEETEEAERTRMAQELHDQVGQSLALLGFNLNMIKSQLKEADIKDLEKIYNAQTLLEEISGGIRSVMDDLRPSILDDYGLLAALHWLSDKYSGRTGIEVEVIGTASEPRLDRRVENSLFRIAQEALTNVARHAEAEQVTIKLIQTPKRVELILEDNGKGFEPEVDPGDSEKRGWGLVNMNERVNRIGGKLSLETGLGKGTRISIQVPRD